MSAFDDAWIVLKQEQGMRSQSFHPAIHGLMRRQRIADEFNSGMGFGPGATNEYQPSDFVEEAYGDYEPKGAAERDPMNPNTLDAMERYGTLVRQSNPGAQDPASMEGVLDNISRRPTVEEMLERIMNYQRGSQLTEQERNKFGPERVSEGDY